MTSTLLQKSGKETGLTCPLLFHILINGKSFYRDYLRRKHKLDSISLLVTFESNHSFTPIPSYCLHVLSKSKDIDNICLHYVKPTLTEFEHFVPYK